MASDINEVASLMARHATETRDHGVGQFRANALMNVATLTLLIDAGLITEDVAISRIEEIASTFPDLFKAENTTPKIEFLIRLLKKDPPAATYIGEFMRQKEKEMKKGADPSQGIDEAPDEISPL